MTSRAGRHPDRAPAGLELLSQSQLAGRLGRDPARIRELVARGVLQPIGEGRAARFAWLEALAAWVEYQAERRAEQLVADAARRAPTELEAAELRRAQAEAVRAETRAQREAGELIPQADSVAEVRLFCERLRGVIAAFPSRYQDTLGAELGVPASVAGAALRRLVGELMGELQRHASMVPEPAEAVG